MLVKRVIIYISSCKELQQDGISPSGLQIFFDN